MKRARVILVLIGFAGLAGGMLACFTPNVYYRPAYVGGDCTVAFTPVYSVVTDRRMPGREVRMAKEPGRCEVYIIVGE